MDDFAKLQIAERKPYFETAARQLGFTEAVIEKDFWVCWTLKRLFSLKPISESLIFKGGTSLSKVFKVIERFSEDIDISIDKKTLGFSDVQDPEKAKSTKQQILLIEKLSEVCRDFVQKNVQKDLKLDIQDFLGNTGWTLETDPSDNDGQTLLFYYPSAFKSDGYVRGIVKIEIGARSDHWPKHTHSVRPYIADQFSDIFKEPVTQVKVLDAARTFWEKATILHMYANFPEGKSIMARQSRHYYDFYQLIGSQYGKEAMANLDLLRRVAAHKKIYFRAAWAKYEDATPGSLKLIPGPRVLEAMTLDYSQMADMFFGAQPKWETVLETLRAFEVQINSIRSDK